jgi:hypothetical protein
MRTVRTTVTLDADVARALRAEIRRSGSSLKQVVNAALRRGLPRRQKPRRAVARFRVEPLSTPFQPGVDSSRLNRLSDELELEAFLSRVEGNGGRR